ncbi:hypothetical protein C8J57DRAFT_1316800 [Mycena rebaudengoi]|nr:hypothetical protein C8J57DRAFT_1316800 [Mycena rebaudengoi]
MPHKAHHSAHAHALIFFGVLLVLLLAHLALLLVNEAQSRRWAQSSGSRSSSRVQGRWKAVRHAVGLPPVKLRSKLPPLSLPMTSRFDLKRKRALEESMKFSFDDMNPPAQLYFAADALDEDNVISEEAPNTFRMAMARTGTTQTRERDEEHETT